MDKPKFTPGPWVAQKNSTYWEFGKKGSIYSLGDVCATNPGNPDSGEQEANAHLIAAAPELYEALRTIVDHGMVTLSDYEDAVAVLANARGEDA